MDRPTFTLTDFELPERSKRSNKKPHCETDRSDRAFAANQCGSVSDNPPRGMTPAAWTALVDSPTAGGARCHRPLWRREMCRVTASSIPCPYGSVLQGRTPPAPHGTYE